MKHLLSLLALTALLAACADKQPTPEEKGMQLLQEARALLDQGQLTAARDTIISLRQHYPTAVDARRQAILTLDSIELQAARDSGLDLKVEFYQRKIEFDKENLKK